MKKYVGSVGSLGCLSVGCLSLSVVCGVWQLAHFTLHTQTQTTHPMHTNFP